MIEAFRISGMLAGILMIIAGLTGFFGPALRKMVKGPAILRIHRWCGISAEVFGSAHGLIYMLFLG